MLRKSSAVLLMLSLSIDSMAQSAGETPEKSIREVVIEGARFTGSVDEQNNGIQIITRKQIAALPVQNVNELLKYVAGVDIRTRGPMGAQADIVIDGSTFDQVLVMVNGVKMSDPQTGHHLMNLPVPLDAIDHIEVIRGAAGRSYGVNALAGAVNIITKIPLQTMAFGGTYGGSSFESDTSTGETYYNWGLQAGAAIRKDKHAHLLSFSHDQSNGYRYNTGFENYKAFYQTELLAGNHKVEVMGAYVHNAFGANAFYAAPGDKESEETVQTAFGSVSDTWKVNDKLVIRPRVSFRYGKDDYIYIRQKPAVFRNLHETNVVNADVNATYTFGKHSIGAGIDYRNENIRSTNLGFNTRDYVGVFAEYKIVINKFSAGAGVYGNYSSEWDFELFPGVDAGYAVNSNVKLYANVGTGQRLPTYTDLYYDGPSNIGNENLIPETGVTAEGGIKIYGNFLQADGSVSYKNISDFIDYTRVDVNDEWQPNNFQTIKTTVYNVRLEYKAGKHLNWKESKQLNVMSSYSYLEPDVTNNAALESKYAVEALRHQWLSSLVFKTGNLTFSANAHYQFRINGNDYTLLDGRLGYTLKKFMVFADVSNLLDTQYREIASVPLPGRWFGLGVKFNSNSF